MTERRYCPIPECVPMARRYADPHTSCGHEAAIWHGAGELAEVLAPHIMRGTPAAIRDDAGYPLAWSALYNAAVYVAERLPCDISGAVDSAELVAAIGRPELGEDRWEYAGRLREAIAARICAEPAR